MLPDSVCLHLYVCVRVYGVCGPSTSTTGWANHALGHAVLSRFVCSSRKARGICDQFQVIELNLLLRKQPGVLQQLRYI